MDELSRGPGRKKITIVHRLDHRNSLTYNKDQGQDDLSSNFCPSVFLEGKTSKGLTKTSGVVKSYKLLWRLYTSRRQLGRVYHVLRLFWTSRRYFGIKSTCKIRTLKSVFGIISWRLLKKKVFIRKPVLNPWILMSLTYIEDTIGFTMSSLLFSVFTSHTTGGSLNGQVSKSILKLERIYGHFSNERRNGYENLSNNKK